MPLILDNPMGGGAMQVDLDDVDDLFGDGVPLNLHDGQSLELRYLRADPKDGTWGLSEPTPLAPWPNLAGGPLVHLSWGPAVTSSELAVIDAVGRVLIFNFGLNLNRPTLTRRWDTDPIDDLHAVVGTYWLNLVPPNPAKLNPVYGPAVKNEANNYHYDTTSVPSNPPWHPYPNRSAFICVTTNGVLKMFWVSDKSKIEETTLELESVTSADDLVTHAAICGDFKNKCLFVAVATTSKQLRVVQVVISWNIPKQENSQAMPPGGFNFGPPTLMQRHVALTSWFQAAASNSHLDTSMTKISHIEWLPGVPVMATKSFSNPVVLTVRSFVSPLNSPYSQEVQSIIDRWELLMEQKETLHPAFEQLGSRRNSTGTVQPASIRLKKLDSIVVNKIVTGVSVISHGKVVCFTYSDGSVEHRDRLTMEELYTEVNLDRVSSILEAGFSQRGEPLFEMLEDGKIKWHPINYTLADPATMTDAQLSAVVAGITAATANAVTSSSNMDDILAIARSFSHKDRKSPYKRPPPAPMQFCFSILQHLGWRGEYQPRDFSSKLAMIMLNLRNIVIIITIANNTNALRGATTPMDDPDVVNALAGCCKWAVDLLSWLCDSLFCLLDDNKFKSIVTNPAQFPQLTGYLLEKNEIALHMVLSSSIRNLLGAVCRRITALNNLSLRAISHYEARMVTSGSNNNNNNNNNNANSGPPAGSAYGSPLHVAYQKVYRHTSSALISPEAFQALLASLNREVRDMYVRSFAKIGAEQQVAGGKGGGGVPSQQQQSDATARARQHCELQMLLGQAPPSTFQHLVAKFLYQDLAAFRDGPNGGGGSSYSTSSPPPPGSTSVAADTNNNGGGGSGMMIDPARLFFADYDILEVDDAPRALERRRARGVRVDLFRRAEIFRPSGRGGGAGPGWRRCVRCASVMEDVGTAANKPHLNFVLSQQRNCCCGGRLALLP
ncbi:hypothetical protein DL766_003840 [Monosporascus sp. MC13-8B]|uniref:Mediator of RNA polymerase II transcription subunit 16 n=1 Tax=Monosporascus cannonballus TaxID=155416 RepID=A0ABY0GYA7_9PEZI|nr:hypothetical protein DL762_007920 [Monosporascus cannonballus]RYO90609.1 hypothetical protein DL763_005284 [Monosporascus cannonballus]RYP32752.1 hypothetical protein DL766_003840 [Monosporascus sp. MC13-8B]